jgi:hypothetical protein
LEKSSSLIPLYNPQKHYRKTKSNLVFNNFKYESDWVFRENGQTKFIETFNFNDGNIRRNIHLFYITPMKNIVKTANNYGFKLIDTIDLTMVNHPYNYLMCFKKIYGN